MATDAVPRVRMGILGDRGDADLADYVLEPFLPGERETAEEMVDRAAEAILCLVANGITKTMSQFNRREDGPD
jgi:PTH1 family peptidyl-tRNA hydrolase